MAFTATATCEQMTIQSHVMKVHESIDKSGVKLSYVVKVLQFLHLCILCTNLIRSSSFANRWR